MRIVKQVLPFGIGLLLFLCANLLLNDLMIPSQFPRVKIHNVENGQYQELILGSSHGNSAIDPSVLQEASARTSYNAAAGGQTPQDAYYLLLDACRKAKPERVILEYDPTYWLFLDSFNANSRYQLSVMENSLVKVRYFTDAFFQGDLRYVLMPWSLYPFHPGRIRKILEEKRSEEYRSFSTEPFSDSSQILCENGFYAISDTANGDRSVPELSFQAAKKSDIEKNKKDFESILKLCAKEGIEVCVLTTPVPEETRVNNEAFYREAHTLMKELTEKYGVPYLDFVAPEEGDETVPYYKGWDSEGFTDGEGHMRVSCAENFSSILAGLLA